MREVIYLRIDRHGIRGMTKSLPQLKRGEIPVKLEVIIDPGAFREPVIERQVHVEDWRAGIDLGDVEFRSNIITEDEADVIRKQRLARMADILADHGYTVTDQEVESAPGDQDD